MWPFNKRSHLIEGLLDIEQVIVPAFAVGEAQSHLREVGNSGYEGFALWAGIRDGKKFVVRKAIIPDQMGHRGPEGVCVTVGAEELHRINVWLYEHEMTLIAQLHSHPDEAYHSDTDDAYPIATTVGALSLVLPYYASRPFSLEACAVYRLMPGRGWTHLGKTASSRLITITE